MTRAARATREDQASARTKTGPVRPTRVRRTDQMDPDQPGTYRVVQVPRLDRAVWRYRWQLAPVGAALVAWAAMVGLVRAPFWAILALLGLAALVQQTTRTLRTEERVYAWAALGAGAGWAALVAAAGVHRWGVLLWAALLVAGGVPWWRHRRVRARIHLDRTMRAWPAIADRSGLAGVRAVSVRIDGIAEVLRLEVQRGRQTVQDVSGRLVHIAQVLGLPVRSLRLVPDPNDPGIAELHMVRSDPWRSKTGQPVDLDHPAIADPGRWCAQDWTIRRPLPHGLAQSGDRATISLWNEQGGRILFVAGKKGSGKSTTVHDLLAALAPCPDVRIIGIDVPKRGHTLRPWAPRLHRLATTPQQAIAALQEVYELLGQRGEAGATGDAVHQPTAGDPAYVLIVEELGATVEQVDGIDALLTSIGRLVRSASVTLVLVDQRPDHTTVPGALRGQVDDVIVGRMRRGDARLVLPGHDQVDVSAIPEDMPGQMVQQAGSGPVVPIRVWRLEQRDHIAALVAAALAVVPAAAVEHVPDIASRSTREAAHPVTTRATAATAHERVAAALGAYEHDQADRPAPARGSMAQLADGHAYVEPDQQAGDDELDQALLDAVRAAVPAGVSVADLVERVGRPRATVQRRLGALRRAERLDLRPERGPAARWYTTDSDREPVA